MNETTHTQIGDSNVFDDCSVHGLQRKTAASIEHAIRDGNVLEAAVRLRTALDAAKGLACRQ